MSKYEELLAAAKAYQLSVSANDEIGGEYKADNQLNKAIAAAERELAERLTPIDEQWLVSTGWHDSRGIEVFSIDVSTSIQKLSGNMGWMIMRNTRDMAAIKTRGQLLDLLSGMGFEVAK